MRYGRSCTGAKQQSVGARDLCFFSKGIPSSYCRMQQQQMLLDMHPHWNSVLTIQWRA